MLVFNGMENSFLKIADGGYLLQESGDKIILETTQILGVGYSLGRDNDTKIGVGKARTAMVGYDNDVNTGVGRKLE